MPRRPNAALYFVAEGYSTAGQQLMGIHAASEGLLHAMVRYSGVDRLYAFCEIPASGEAFIEAVAAISPTLPAEWIPTDRAERLTELEALQLPGPGLSAYAWMRRRLGSAAFSLCGVTHTTATPGALDSLADLWIAPIEPWDALICTSTAVQAMVIRVLDDQRSYLEERFGRFNTTRPQLPVIPLGVETRDFADDPGLRSEWRDRLSITPEEVVLLHLGRLNPWVKAHPTPLFLALAQAAKRSRSPLHLVLAGWFHQPELEEIYRSTAEFICPEVRITVVDGRPGPARRGIWRAADIFVSPVDNVQETFGLTPIEAMAAGLPVIVSDWDGYRETVRHGVDGLLVRTLTPPSGTSQDIAIGYGARTIGYDEYVGLVSQATAIDLRGLVDAIVALADDPDRRRAMGESGRRHAEANFDWARIIPRYQELWVELANRRRVAVLEPRTQDAIPTRPEPFRAFASYPTEQLGPRAVLAIGRTSAAMIPHLLASPLIAFAAPRLLPADRLQHLIGVLESGPKTIADLLPGVLESEQAAFWRSLGWLLKYGLIAAD